MRRMGSWAILLGLLMPAQPCLAEMARPEAGSVSRISWAMQCAGPMPPLLKWALTGAAVLTVLSILYYRQVKKRHER